MSFDWTTFFLELVNFLILLWILKRLFFRPVLDMITKRRAAIEKTLADAKAIKAQAEETKSKYEGRMADWEAERNAARAKLADEISAERQQRMARLEQAINAEREKNRTLEARRLEEQARAAEIRAIAQAAGFATRLFERFAGEELDARIAELLVEDLKHLSDEQMQALKEAAHKPGARLEMTSARELPEAVRNRLTRAMTETLGILPSVAMHIDPSLLAGVRLALGPWIMQATLADELVFFRDGARRVG
jgi:F-type H+-transporting ATPase subunit b